MGRRRAFGRRGAAPIPAYLSSASRESRSRIYSCSWFVGFRIAGGLYLVIMRGGAAGKAECGWRERISRVPSMHVDRRATAGLA